MWWWIAGIVIAFLVLFACWIAWELIHAPLVPELFDGCFSEEDDEEERREKENSA